ncbi:hypothetical protein FOA52_004481 [Chlamydomonas sp. UWO 241]|nr:hypothetical protein FOA52_004481 [Chlamydomonas sp. UWO 241]
MAPHHKLSSAPSRSAAKAPRPDVNVNAGRRSLPTVRVVSAAPASRASTSAPHFESDEQPRRAVTAAATATSSPPSSHAPAPAPAAAAPPAASVSERAEPAACAAGPVAPVTEAAAAAAAAADAPAPPPAPSPPLPLPLPVLVVAAAAATAGSTEEQAQQPAAAQQPKPPSAALNADAAVWVAPAPPAVAAAQHATAQHAPSPGVAGASSSSGASSSENSMVAAGHLTVAPGASYAGYCHGHAPPASVASSVHTFCMRDHNSVTIKGATNVKDAAGAIVKVLGRLPTVFVTALRMESVHDALNRAVKSIAVARKYVNDSEASGAEVSFVPFNRTNAAGIVDPALFAFMVFKAPLDVGTVLLEHDATDLNVSRSSNAHTMANAIIRILKERGQAVMKAGGSDAIFIAMSALAHARARLKRKHAMDAMVVPAWITENTVDTLGRESKFLRFNVLPCPVGGPLAAATALHAAAYA